MRARARVCVGGKRPLTPPTSMLSTPKPQLQDGLATLGRTRTSLCPYPRHSSSSHVLHPIFPEDGAQRRWSSRLEMPVHDNDQPGFPPKPTEHATQPLQPKVKKQDGNVLSSHLLLAQRLCQGTSRPVCDCTWSVTENGRKTNIKREREKRILHSQLHIIAIT